MKCMRGGGEGCTGFAYQDRVKDIVHLNNA